jgi:hypothetical protein
MLNNQDKKWIIDLVSESEQRATKLLTAYIDHRLYPIEQKLLHMENLPTKEEFYSLADKILTRLDKIEIELISIKSILSNHEDRIYKLEQKTALF